MSNCAKDWQLKTKGKPMRARAARAVNDKHYHPDACAKMLVPPSMIECAVVQAHSKQQQNREFRITASWIFMGNVRRIISSSGGKAKCGDYAVERRLGSSVARRMIP